MIRFGRLGTETTNKVKSANSMGSPKNIVQFFGSSVCNGGLRTKEDREGTTRQPGRRRLVSVTGWLLRVSSVKQRHAEFLESIFETRLGCGSTNVELKPVLAANTNFLCPLTALACLGVACSDALRHC